MNKTQPLKVSESITSLKENVSNKMDDMLLESEISLEEKKEVLDQLNHQIFESIHNIEDNTFQLLSQKVEVYFNEMRYHKMTEILNDNTLSKHQKEIKLQDNLLNVYQLQNKVEEMLLNNTIQLQDINSDTQEYLKKTFVYGEEFISTISIRVSSLFR